MRSGKARERTGAGNLIRAVNPFEYSLLRTGLQMLYSLPIWFLERPRRFRDPTEHPGTVALAAAAPALVEECSTFLEATVLSAVQVADPAQQRLNRDDRWKAFMVRVNARDIEVNRTKLPRLAQFLDDHAQFTTAAISLLEPGKTVMVHPGPMKGVLRVHLGVIVPRTGRCEMIVGGQSRTWRRGEIMVFDDTFLHRAVNQTPEARAVLFFDLERPLPFGWLSRVNRRFIESMGKLRHVDRIIASAERRRRDIECVD